MKNVDPEVLRAAENLAAGQSTDSVNASPAEVVATVDPHAAIREKYNAPLAKHWAVMMPLVVENSNLLCCVLIFPVVVRCFVILDLFGRTRRQNPPNSLTYGKTDIGFS